MIGQGHGDEPLSAKAESGTKGQKSHRGPDGNDKPQLCLLLAADGDAAAGAGGQEIPGSTDWGMGGFGAGKGRPWLRGKGRDGGTCNSFFYPRLGTDITQYAVSALACFLAWYGEQFAHV